MAKKIELGLELKGQDAVDFLNYIRNPVYTPCGEQMLKRAYELSKARDFKGKR